MPIYPYKCVKCGRTWEAFHKIEERSREKCSCGGRAALLIGSTAKPVVCEYFSEAMNVKITGPKQRAEHMKKNNLAFTN